MATATLPKSYCERELSRDELILRHLSTVQVMAQRMWARCPAHVDLDDLVNAATCGLIEAADVYDPQRGVSFSSFAQARIRGSMLDTLRKMDWTPRSVLRKRRMLAKTLSKIESKLGRAAEETEVAAELGISLAEYHSLLDEIKGIRLESLSAPLDDEEEQCGPTQLEARESENPEFALQSFEAIEALGKAIERLPDKEKLVVTLYFYEEMTLREIGAILKLTEGRISQLKTSALLRLQTMLEAHR